jgi:hypothetical protein
MGGGPGGARKVSADKSLIASVASIYRLSLSCNRLRARMSSRRSAIRCIGACWLGCISHGGASDIKITGKI